MAVLSRFKTLYDTGGEAALQEISRRKPNAKNRVDPAAERAVLDFAREQPACGQPRVSNELRKRGAFVSPSGARSIWLRHDLAAFKGRLKALEARMAQEGIALTESQLAAMERAGEEKEARGETETEHPGYLGAQDTYYVGNIKGVGHVYQQTFIDTYTKVAFRRKVYRSVEEIQLDLDAWLGQYNNERTHSGKYCYGKTPMQTFVDSIPLVKERLFGHDESDGQGA